MGGKPMGIGMADDAYVAQPIAAGAVGGLGGGVGMMN